MLIYFLKSSIRSIINQKFYAILNILGLTIGIASFLLIMVYVVNELMYDRFHKDSDQIYRIAGIGKIGSQDITMAISPAPVTTAFSEEIPAITSGTRIRKINSTVLTAVNQENSDFEVFKESGIFFADSNFFQFFSFKLLSGNASTVLKNPNSIVLSETMAKKYFGSADYGSLMGKILLEGRDRNQYVVTGIFKDIPRNSHFHFDALLSMSSTDLLSTAHWGNFSVYSYVKVNPEADLQTLTETINKITREHLIVSFKQLGISWEDFEKQGNRLGFFLQPLTSIHLDSHLENEIESNGSIIYIYVFSAIALLILLIGCINFINLSTAKLIDKTKDVMMKKILGSKRKWIIGQSLTESFIYTLISMILAIFIFNSGLRLINTMLGDNLSLDLIQNGWYILAILSLFIFIGLISGIYPAIQLSSVATSALIPGRIKVNFKGNKLRNALVIFQFMISVGLIFSSIIILKQVIYARNKDLGFDKENVIIINNFNELGSHRSTFKEDLLAQSFVMNASISSALPGRDYYSKTLYRPEAPSSENDQLQIDKNDLPINLFFADNNYVGTFGMDLIAGRNFSTRSAGDSTAVIINEAVIRQFSTQNEEWKDPIGKAIYMTGWKGSPSYQVIGVLKDYNFHSIREYITPLVMFLGEGGNLIVRIQKNSIPEALKYIENRWEILVPGVPLEYSFLDQDLEAQMGKEKQLIHIISFFTGLAILIACLGLFGLSTYTAEVRTKEIGIRKVLGSDTTRLVLLLSRKYLMLVFAGAIIAVPVAIFIMRRWLENFAYKVHISLLDIVLTSVLALILSWLTIMNQSIRIARKNPVETLRYE